MSDRGRIGDKAGYVVLRQLGEEWVKTPSVTFENISHAVGKIRHYQERSPNATFAVARLELVMISRPDSP